MDELRLPCARVDDVRTQDVRCPGLRYTFKTLSELVTGIYPIVLMRKLVHISDGRNSP